MIAPAALPGRPLRAALLLAGLALLWLVARLPALRADFAATLAALTPAAPAPAAPPAPAPPVAPGATGVAAGPAPAPYGASARLHPPPRERAHPETAPEQPRDMPETAPAPAPDRPQTAPAPAPDVPQTTPFSLADQAYRRLQAGDRRGAARLFDQALALEPGNRQWARDRAALTRRWHGSAFWLARAAGPTGPTTAPVLGGGQWGAGLAFTPDPLARRPVALVARAVGADGDPKTAQAALGLRWTLAPGLSLSAERLQAIGEKASNDWTLRAATGGSRGRVDWYGEAGILSGGGAYGGGQTRVRAARIGPLDIGAGAWGGFQTGRTDASRLDAGPSVSGRLGPLRVQADWRFRLAGNAAPGDGPALTISGDF